jgi:PAS domain S-box-containing protein
MDVKKILYEIKTADNAGEYLSELFSASGNSPEMQRFLEFTPGILCVIGADGFLKNVSAAFARYLGYTPQELVKIPFKDLLIQHYLITNRHEASGQKTPYSKAKALIRCKDGSTAWFLWITQTDPETGNIYASAKSISEDEEMKLQLELNTEGLKQLLQEKDESLLHARSMQKVLMPYEEQLQNSFVESFIFSVPKDILSGNFCWIQKQDEKIYIAVADCSWHSVPGALISLVCSNALTRAITEFKLTDTGRILDKMRELVGNLFDHPEFGSNDGIDISLCCINKSTCIIEWSGANNQLLFLHNGIMQELVGDKLTIGNKPDPISFTTHKMYLSKGDILYLFSDGYAEQFGGDIGKKLLYKKFQSMLIKLAPLRMELQRERLHKEFDKWKGELAQSDDVLVVGVRL